MSFGRMGGRGGFGFIGATGFASASSYAAGPAPAGFHWEFVTLNGDRVMSSGVYVVALVAN